MNKKILIILFLIPILLISTTSCGNNRSNKNKEKIEFKDEESGYITNLYYNKKDNFSDISQRISKPTTLSFTNKDLNVEFLMSYSKYNNNIYKNTKKSRKEQKYFQEYKFGKYEAYTYGNYDERLNMIILLDNSKKNGEIDLNITITRIEDKNKTIVKEVVDSDTIQNFLKSIDFKIEKKK